MAYSILKDSIALTAVLFASQPPAPMCNEWSRSPCETITSFTFLAFPRTDHGHEG